jgi:hypothetical protein
MNRSIHIPQRGQRSELRGQKTANCSGPIPNPQSPIPRKKGTVPDQPSVGARRNGPEGAPHKWGLSPFSGASVGQ